MIFSKRVPRKHQEEALKRLEGKKAFAILMAMRTGKSKVVVDDFSRLLEEGKVKDLLIIAPAGAYSPWVDAISADLPDQYESITKVFKWVSFSRKKREVKDAFEAFVKYRGPRVFIVNVEAVSSVYEAKTACINFLMDSPNKNMLVIDESVVIKNPASICSKFCVDSLAPLSEYRRILSGLVSPKSPLDIYQQYKFLSRDIFPEKYKEFSENHTIFHRVCNLPIKQIEHKYRLHFEIPADAQVSLTKSDMVDALIRANRYVPHIPIIKGYKNVEQIAERIAPYSFRVRLEDTFDMPEADYSFRDVEMTKEQEKAYGEMKAFFSAQNGESIVSASTVVVQMLKLHQILCGHTKTEEGFEISFPENRTKELINILQDYDGKAIIWAAYDANVRSIELALKKSFGENSIARFWGGNVKTRDIEEHTFKTDPECRFMIATPDAGGRGRTWDVADLVIYYSCRNNLDHRAQSEERAKNVGKIRPVSYIDIRCPGTVEDKIIDALRRKIDLATLVARDPKVTNWVI